MAETLGSLCDKLTVVRLKQWHTQEPRRLASLARQLTALEIEMDDFVSKAVSRQIPASQLKFDANKVYRKRQHAVREVTGEIGGVFSKLAGVNCALWHQQEKIYDFARVPASEKDGVIKRLAILNLERNRCIEVIDDLFREKIVAMNGKVTRTKPARAAGKCRPR